MGHETKHLQIRKNMSYFVLHRREDVDGVCLFAALHFVCLQILLMLSLCFFFFFLLGLVQERLS